MVPSCGGVYLGGKISNFLLVQRVSNCSFTVFSVQNTVPSLHEHCLFQLNSNQ